VTFSTSFDESIYDTFMATQQLSTAGLGQSLIWSPFLGAGQVATTANTALLGTTDPTTTAFVNNTPINPGFIKVRWIVLGTSPSFAFTVGYIGNPQDLSD
jgi:hypothetical protein